MWFETLMGCPETSPQQVRAALEVEGECLRSRANGRQFVYGKLEIPSLKDLRTQVARIETTGQLSVQEIIGDVQALHGIENAGALFQVASQFNLLEMVSPQMTPEQGVGGYESDQTQGPACAIAAGAGTIYRNYFVPVKGQIGQSATHQIDCLADLGSALGNTDQRLWEMKNGYALATKNGLIEISERLQAASEAERDELRQLLRVGIQWNTQVTLKNAQHRVSQVYCSALPVAYSGHSASLWEPFARLVLEAAYEATLCVALLNRHTNQDAETDDKHKLFLTLLGGGAFGNEPEWIAAAIERALNRYRQADLEVKIVCYRAVPSWIGQLVRRCSS
jgi:hypothetical protein